MTQRDFHIECAIAAENTLFLVGWICDLQRPACALILERVDGGRSEYRFADGAEARCLRTFRPDVHRTLQLKPDLGATLGIALAVPLTLESDQSVGVSFDVTELSPQVVMPQSIAGAARNTLAILPHSGHALKELAVSVGATDVVTWIDNAEIHPSLESARSSIAVDHALMLAGTLLILHGWIGASAQSIKRARIVGKGVDIDVTESIVRTYRPDLFTAFRELAPASLGFLLVLGGDECAGALALSLEVDLGNAVRSVAFCPETAGWSDCLTRLNQTPHLRAPLLTALKAHPRFQSLPGAEANLAWFTRESFNSIVKRLPRGVFNDDSTHAAVDRAFVCGNSTIAAIGWHVQPRARLVAVKLCSSDGTETDVADSMFRLSRRDVTDPFKGRFPHLNEHCGFALCASVSPPAQSLHALRFELDNGAVEWIQVSPTEEVGTGEGLLKILAECVGDPGRQVDDVISFFETGFGRAIEELGSGRAVPARVVERQFGQPPPACEVSVIVPLYGRYDFLRHQLAHFADDPDFSSIDLIYVVDDPRIVPGTLALAAHYAALFRVPFRVIHYGGNLGFAGANNVGSRAARAKTLLLLNSDVIPAMPRWVSALHTAFQELPDAAAIGPLLLFPDGSVQHGGMAPLIDPGQPGLVWNSHPGKGAPWSRGSEPMSCSMLTGACLMISASDYRTCGGLDEGYLVGDFEDSDLCLKLRKSGRKLWLVPTVRMWHLERQSLNIGAASDQRRMTTLYNGWRYLRRIERRELADPFSA